MKLIEWDERLSIDKGVIDEDHQKLIEIINRFLKKDGKYESAQELVDILDELDAYTIEHFRNEENLQRISGFPDREAHYNEHHRLTRTLEKLREEVRPTGGSYVNVMGEKVGNFLREWLFDHIFKSDMKMKPYAEKLRRAEEAAAQTAAAE